MFVKLFTGLPGAGKTAQLVAEIQRLAKEESHRPIFAMGINGLQEGLAIPLTMEMLEAWWELPTGAIIAIDECQESHLMPQDAGKPKEWVKRIAKVRHHGMTFLLTTQAPANMSAFVRRLVDQHVHTVNKFGTAVIARYTWGQCQDEPQKRSIQKHAVESLGTLPKEVFGLYKSSQLHTRKRRIPRKVYMFAACALLALGAVVSAPILIKRAHDQSQASIAGTPVVSSEAVPKARPAERNRNEVDDDLRRTDYPKWLAPRVPGQPWTAPAFDHLEVVAQPRVFCVANEDGGCHCRTEQGTRYEVEANLCRAMVNEGGPYNPFQPNPDLVRSNEQARPAAQAALPPTQGVSAATVQPRGEWAGGVGTPVYTPPEHTRVGAIGSGS